MRGGNGGGMRAEVYSRTVYSLESGVRASPRSTSYFPGMDDLSLCPYPRSSSVAAAPAPAGRPRAPPAPLSCRCGGRSLSCLCLFVPSLLALFFAWLQTAAHHTAKRSLALRGCGCEWPVHVPSDAQMAARARRSLFPRLGRAWAITQAVVAVRNTISRCPSPLLPVFRSLARSQGVEMAYRLADTLAMFEALTTQLSSRHLVMGLALSKARARHRPRPASPPPLFQFFGPLPFPRLTRRDARSSSGSGFLLSYG